MRVALLAVLRACMPPNPHVYGCHFKSAEWTAPGAPEAEPTSTSCADGEDGRSLDSTMSRPSVTDLLQKAVRAQVEAASTATAAMLHRMGIEPEEQVSADSMWFNELMP